MEPTVWHSNLPGFEPTPTFADKELLRHAGSHPSAVALADADGRRKITFAQLSDGASRLAAGLSELGIGRGDVVAIIAVNHPDFGVALCGSLQAGATVATANPALTAAEIERQLRIHRAKLVFADAYSLAAVREAATLLDEATAIYALDGASGAPPISRLLRPPQPEPPDRDPADLAFLFPSGGTTGLPKIAAHRHSGASAWLEGFARTPSTLLHPGDVVAIAAPFTHMFGCAVMSHALRSGARVVSRACPTFDLERYLRMLADSRATVINATPPLAIALARHPLVERFDLSALRLVILGAAPCPTDVQEELEARLSCRVGDFLGSTEAWCYAPPADPLVRGSVGALAPNMEAMLLDPDTGDRVGAHEPGELCIRGPQVMAGYLGDERASANVIDPDGWMHTGDLCSIDLAGNIYILDRLKELIKVGGCSVAPGEVERELVQHPAVSDAAVVGRPHPELGEVPVAYVTLRDGASADEVLGAWLDARLATWKHPREAIVIEQVPYTPLGKVDRRALRQREREAVLA
jgi:X-X-X-Leu-X-X-Gly heptad repeat protein